VTTYNENVAQTDDEQWDIVIEPRSGLFELNLKSVWHYRDLLWLFVKRDFTAQYKQTILGPLWHLIQPLLTTAMFLVVFTRIARIPTEGVPPVLFYMSGLTVWNYFSACLNSTSNTFIANSGIFGKVYFPRLVIPLSVVLSNISRFIIQLVLLFSIAVYYAFRGYHLVISPFLLLIPVLLLVLAGMGLGLGIIISSLTTKYRDFTVLVGFGVQLLMYLTPVAYPLSYLSSSKYLKFIYYNPLSPLLEAFRYALFNTGSLSASGLLYSCCCMIILLFSGILLFTKVEKSFMDTV